jgi:regulator of sigma D
MMAGYKSKKKMAESKTIYPKIEKGSHLTVTTYEDGRTELEWDDEALMRDVRDAIAAHEATEMVGAIALGGKPRTRARK